MTRAWLAVLACGCWRGAPPPEPTQPAPLVAAPRARRVTRVVEAPPPKTTQELADELARELRDNASAPQQYLASQIVHDDLAQPSQQTLTGRQADQAAVQWGQLLVEPTRSTPRCNSGPGPKRSFVCMQIHHGTAPTLVLQFCRGVDTWELVGVLEGDIRSPTARQRFVNFHATMSNSCP